MPSVFSDCRLLPPVGKSDHNVVVYSLNLPLRVCQDGNKLNKRINYDTLQQRLTAINWQILLAASINVNDMWNIFQETVIKAIDDCTTMVRSQTIYVRRKLRALFLHKKRRWRQ